MSPRVSFRAAVLVTVFAVAVELTHNIVNIHTQAVPARFADVCQKVGKVWCKLIPFDHALPDALRYTGINLAVSEFPNRVDPE